MENIVQYYHKTALEQVNLSITDEGKLAQQLEQLLLSRQFLESCLASDSSDVGAYQFLIGLVANGNISAQEVQDKFFILFSKIRVLKELLDLRVKVESRQNSSSSTSSHRKRKKLLKQRFLLLTRSNDVLTDIVNDFWHYLPIEVQKALKETNVSFLEIDAKTHILRAEAKLRYYGRLSDLAKKQYLFYKSLSALRISLLKATDIQEHNEIPIEEDEYQSRKLSNFFDSVMDSALSDPSRYLEVYTEEMAAEDDELTKDVLIDD